MVPVAGTPMIAYALAWLRAGGIDTVAVNLHYKPDPIVAFVGDGSSFGLSVHYSREPELLGSSGSLVPLRALFAGEAEFVVLYGDVLTDLTLADVLADHRAGGADATVVLTTVEDPRRAGMVELDADRWIRRFVEKPAHWDGPAAWANGGIYVLGPRVLEFLPAGGAHDFAFDLFPAMSAAGARLRGYPSDAVILDIGSHERLAVATDLVERGRLPRPQVAA
jgi:NDP-sugar pyrophosphorylase family protein